MESYSTEQSLETYETPVLSISGENETKLAETPSSPKDDSDSDSAISDGNSSSSDEETDEQITNRKNYLDSLMRQIECLKGCADFDKLPIPYNYQLIYDCLYGHKDPMEYYHRFTRDEIIYYNEKARELNEKYALEQKLKDDALKNPFKKH